MQKFLIQVVLLFLVIGVSTFLVFQQNNINFLVGLNASPAGDKLKVGNTVLNIETADNDQTRSKGLGGRDKLASDSGMLFTFDKIDKYKFWMKDMKFPLDFIFIKDSQVVDTLQNIAPPAPNQTDDTLPIYEPVTYVNKVLEVNAGFIQNNGIKIGDSVSVFKGQ
jgi:uncharacterized protein